MKIAVTYENGQIFQHFGKTEQFKIFDINDNKIESSKIIDTDGKGHGALGGFLRDNAVDTLICGGIGAGAQQALDEALINFYGGVTGDADKAVEDLLAGKLVYNPDVKCSHHRTGGHDNGAHKCV